MLLLFFVSILQMDRRVEKAKALKNLVVYDKPIFILGMGCIGQALMPLLFQLVKLDPKKITIMDKLDMRPHIQHYLNKGVKFVKGELTKQNYKSILKPYKDGFFVDCAWDVYTLDMLKYCKLHNILYCNTSVEEWDPFSGTHKQTQDYTLYDRQMEIRELIQAGTGIKGHATAILDHGANPGFVSHLVKRALLDITRNLIANQDIPAYKQVRLEKYAKLGDFKLLAMELGVRVIHISERDTQITDKPREHGEFANTWSIRGFEEESSVGAELGYGTHEKHDPEDAVHHKYGDRNQIVLHTRGINAFAQTWVKSGRVIGNIIRHGEAFSLSDRLAVYPEDAKNPQHYLTAPRNKDHTSKVIYRPTVYYVYRPCDAALAGLREFAEGGFKNIEKERILSDEIISGRDELGVTLFGDFGVKHKKAWFCGSLLDINESRAIIDPKKTHISATSLQVASSLVAAIIYCMRHPNEGILLPDDVNHKEILDITTHFWGPLYSGWIDCDWEKIKDMQFESFRYKDEI